MREWLKRNLSNIIAFSFVIPILLVAFVSISHVTKFYELSNPISWAIYLSVGIEIAALAALAGVSAKFRSFIYLPFGIVTFIQFIGNVYFAYSFINEGSKQFLDWVDLMGAVLEPMGLDSTNIVGHKRILALFSGGLLPLISLTFAHMLVVYTSKNETIEEVVEEVIEEPTIEEPVVENVNNLELALEKLEKQRDDETEPNNDDGIRRLSYKRRDA
jgi:hypothetical protein